MSHFYGKLHGNRGPTTRCGSKGSGIQTIAASWQGAVRVNLYHDDNTGLDMASVWLKPWEGTGVSMSLYDGPVNPQPAGDVDAALRCRTCIHFNNWECKANGPEARVESSAPERGETDGSSSV